MYIHGKATWKSPVLVSRSMTLSLKAFHIPKSWGQESRGTAAEGWPAASQTALWLKLATVTDERGVKEHHGTAAQANAAQGKHLQKSLTTKGCQLAAPGCANEASQQTAMPAMGAGY